ncbi:L,D-transpeptidase family protein [Rhizobium beringeri]
MVRLELCGSTCPSQPSEFTAHPEPSRIDKTGSHGCVRLTNWDAEELAKLLTKDVLVQFM